MALNYIGNNDYRGYLNYLGQSGDQNAANLLNYVGNDGVMSDNGGTPLISSVYAPLNSTYYAKYQAASNGYDPGSTAGSGTGDNETAGQLSYYDDQESRLRGLLGSAQRSLGDGLTQLQDDYNKQAGDSTAARERAATGFKTKRVDTTNDKLGAINQVNTNARTLADGVRRMIGQASGSNSSAYQFAAPNAIARDTSIKRTGVNDTYARNFKSIDTAEEDTMGDFDRFMRDLNDERKAKESALRGGIYEQEMGIQDDLSNIARQRTLLQGGGYDAVRQATAPYQSAISQRQSALDNLFSQFRTPYQTQAAQVKDPTLSGYQVDKTAMGTPQAAAGNYSPYSSFLRKRFQEPA